MRIRPLTGQVLIEVLPAETVTPGGVSLPVDVSVSAETIQESHLNPEKPAKNHIGIVCEIGSWPKTRNGMLRMPEFGRGARVVFNPFRGQEIQFGAVRLRMVNQRDVLAVIG